jgi:leader peptidase (prepilin peptidase)/N-methyltransferase
MTGVFLPAVALGAVLGGVIGSFVAALVLRWGEGRSVMRGRSCCDRCGLRLGPVELVPLLSFVVQRGRARCCGAPIDRFHLWVELVGVAIGISAFLLAEPATALAGACFGWGLLALALLDLRHFWLPDRIVLPLGLLGLAMGWFDLGAPFADRLIGAAVGFAALELIRLAYRALRHRDGLGAGDAKLFAAIGAWLGWHVLPAVMLVACLTGLMAASLLAVRGRRISAVSRLPLGLFLAIAAWVMWCATMSFVER